MFSDAERKLLRNVNPFVGPRYTQQEYEAINAEDDGKLLQKIGNSLNQGRPTAMIDGAVNTDYENKYDLPEPRRKKLKRK